MAATNTTHRCTRCGRILRSAASIARSLGRGCQAKIRAAAKAKAISEFKPTTIEKAQQLIADRGIVAIRTRRTPVFRVVASNGAATYLTAPQACNCAAGLRSTHPCYHRVAATILAAA